MGASCAVPEGAFSSPFPQGKIKGGKKKEKTSEERRAETFPLLLHRVGQQGSPRAWKLGLPFPSAHWEVTISYVSFPSSASSGCSILRRGSEVFHSPLPSGMPGRASSDLRTEPRRCPRRAVPWTTRPASTGPSLPPSEAPKGNPSPVSALQPPWAASGCSPALLPAPKPRTDCSGAHRSPRSCFPCL